MAENLLEIKAAAVRLGVSAKSVYRLVYADQLKAVPVGLGKIKPRIRIPESDLLRFMKAGVQ